METSDNESIIEFLEDLPSHDESNFTLFDTDRGIRSSSMRLTKYVPTNESSSEQIIVNEESNVSFLHQQCEQKQDTSPEKHDQIKENDDESQPC